VFLFLGSRSAAAKGERKYDTGIRGYREENVGEENIGRVI